MGAGTSLDGLDTLYPGSVDCDWVTLLAGKGGGGGDEAERERGEGVGVSFYRMCGK